MAKTKGTSKEILPATTGEEREKVLKATEDEIIKKFGKGSIMRFGDDGPSMEVEAIPTGALALDAALGIGGVPRGRIVEIYGPESSGKTTLVARRSSPRPRPWAASSRSSTPSTPSTPAMPRASVSTSMTSSSPSPTPASRRSRSATCWCAPAPSTCVVVDSVAALVPRAEIEGEIGDTTVGLQARLMSQALSKLAGSLSKSNTTCIFINQLREKIGVMFGNPETTTWRSRPQVLRVRPHGHPPHRQHQGQTASTSATASASRSSRTRSPLPSSRPSSTSCTAKGISKEGSLLDMAVEYNIVNKSGSWFTYDTERLGQGREAAKEFLATNPDLMAEIDHKVRVACGLELGDEPAGMPVEDADAGSLTE